jgi:hypothetical protein
VNETYPVIAELRNGDRVIGIERTLARELYDAGTPPVHVLARKPPPSNRVADVRIGDRLRVERVGNVWVVSDASGELGALRWRPSDDGKKHATTGRLVRLPQTGTLHVQQVLIDQQGTVKDIRCYVQPN